MRVLILTQWFTPEPTLKGIEFAKELMERGHSVQVVTGFPNYPGGTYIRGYQVRLIEKETMEGVSVIRLPLYPSHDRSALRRIANYVTFAVAAAVVSPFAIRRADVAYVYHPPATIGLPALSLRLLRRVPFVLDVQDLWPDTLEATGMVRSIRVLGLVGLWTRVVYRFASRVSVLSPGFKRKLILRKVPESKISVTYNWAPTVPTSEKGLAQEVAAKLAGKFNVVFAGSMGPAQALHEVLNAASLIAHELEDVQFVMIGGGVEVTLLKDMAHDMGLSNVVFIPRMPLTEIGSVLQLADVLLVHLRADPLFEITIPSKTQAYLAAGKPILMAVGGDAADLVENAQAGVRCAPEDPDAIAAGVQGAVQHVAGRSRSDGTAWSRILRAQSLILRRR